MSSKSPWWRELTPQQIIELPTKKLQELAADPDYQRDLQQKRVEQEERIRGRIELLERDQRPINADLALAGVGLSLRQMEAKGEFDSRAIPIMVSHLERPHDPGTLETMARALGNRKESRDLAWDPLSRLLRSEVAMQNPGNLQFAIAAALADIADKGRLDEVAALAEDRSLGSNRLAFFKRLRMSRHPRAREILEAASHDPEVALEARDQLRKLLKSTATPPAH
jgi:HEAT repeat protein